MDALEKSPGNVSTHYWILIYGPSCCCGCPAKSLNEVGICLRLKFQTVRENMNKMDTDDRTSCRSSTDKNRLKKQGLLIASVCSGNKCVPFNVNKPDWMWQNGKFSVLNEKIHPGSHTNTDTHLTWQRVAYKHEKSSFSLLSLCFKIR